MKIERVSMALDIEKSFEGEKNKVVEIHTTSVVLKYCQVLLSFITSG